MYKKISFIAKQFNINDDILSVMTLNGGLINATYVFQTKNNKYILQQINSFVFPNVANLMENITKVTLHLKNKGATTLQFLQTNTNKSFFEHDGQYFRIYNYIDNALTYFKAPNENAFYNIGIAFGEFQNLLSDFDVSNLYETIKDFHNTKKRFNDFLTAVNDDKFNLLSTCQNQVNIVLSKKDTLSLIVDGLNDGSIPLRVTHNDTKTSNVLIDKNTLLPKAVIDLDTVMPGSMLYDFGDAIRTGASLSLEDESDFNKIAFSKQLFYAFTKGFYSSVKNSITKKEISLLAYSAYLMTMECGIRFLTDYLDGGVYFTPKDNSLNLLRARNQIKLALQIEENLPILNNMVNEIVKNGENR